MTLPVVAFPAALRVVAVLVTIAGTLEYFVLDVFIAGSFVVASVLVALSYASSRWKQAVARVVLALSAVIPVMAIAGAVLGLIHIVVPVFDTLVFGWLFSRALGPARAQISATSVS